MTKDWLGRNFRRVAVAALSITVPVALALTFRKCGWDLIWPGKDICFKGCPAGAPPSNRVVKTPVYVLSNNGETKFADWVAYVVSPASLGKTRPRVWHRDSDLPKNETLSPRDYRDVDKMGMARGHQAPVSSLTGLRHWQEANDLSNITPQSKTLNNGAWKSLESAERRLSRKEKVSVYVATGPLYERKMPKLPHAHLPHRVPSGYWKVIAVERNGEIETAAFVLDQKSKVGASFCKSAVSIRAVEARAHLNLLPALDQPSQDRIETGRGALLPRLKCKK